MTRRDLRRRLGDHPACGVVAAATGLVHIESLWPTRLPVSSPPSVRNGFFARSKPQLKLEALASTRYVPPYEIAGMHLALGDEDRALTLLNDACEHRSHSMAFVAVDPRFDVIRRDSRFAALLRRVGFDAGA